MIFCRIQSLTDQLATLALKNNWSGILVYGAIRDSAVIKALNLESRGVGLVALGTCPVKSIKGRCPGEKQIPLVIFGVSIEPGMHVYADEDGVLVSNEKLV